jgi:hypothetical protein
MPWSWGGRALVAATVLLSGCAAQVRDTISTEGLASERKGIVVLLAESSAGCSGRANLHLGRFDPDSNGWIPVVYINGGTTGRADANDPLVEKEVPAGEYGVIQMRCYGRKDLLWSVDVVLNVPRAPTSGPGHAVIARPLAVFTVGPGEVVNVGAIAAIPAGPKTFVAKVGPIPPELLAQFAAAKPLLASRMVTRLMTIPTGNAQIGRSP